MSVFGRQKSNRFAFCFTKRATRMYAGWWCCGVAAAAVAIALYVSLSLLDFVAKAYHAHKMIHRSFSLSSLPSHNQRCTFDTANGMHSFTKCILQQFNRYGRCMRFVLNKHGKHLQWKRKQKAQLHIAPHASAQSVTHECRKCATNSLLLSKSHDSISLNVSAHICPFK